MYPKSDPALDELSAPHVYANVCVRACARASWSRSAGRNDSRINPSTLISWLPR